MIAVLTTISPNHAARATAARTGGSGANFSRATQRVTSPKMMMANPDWPIFTAQVIARNTLVPASAARYCEGSR